MQQPRILIATWRSFATKSVQGFGSYQTSETSWQSVSMQAVWLGLALQPRHSRFVFFQPFRYVLISLVPYTLSVPNSHPPASPPLVCPFHRPHPSRPPMHPDLHRRPHRIAIDQLHVIQHAGSQMHILLGLDAREGPGPVDGGPAVGAEERRRRGAAGSRCLDALEAVGAVGDVEVWAGNLV